MAIAAKDSRPSHWDSDRLQGKDYGEAPPAPELGLASKCLRVPEPLCSPASTRRRGGKGVNPTRDPDHGYPRKSPVQEPPEWRQVLLGQGGPPGVMDMQSKMEPLVLLGAKKGPSGTRVAPQRSEGDETCSPGRGQE